MRTVATVANATASELVCITYELFLEEIEAAINNKEERKVHLEKALEVLRVLADNLDLGVGLAQNLFRLYIYIQGLLVQHPNTEEKLREAYTLMHTVYEGYVEVAKGTTDKRPCMENTENVYAGMTYGKAAIEEVIVNKNRGFQA